MTTNWTPPLNSFLSPIQSGTESSDQARSTEYESPTKMSYAVPAPTVPLPIEDRSQSMLEPSDLRTSFPQDLPNRPSSPSGSYADTDSSGRVRVSRDQARQAEMEAADAELATAKALLTVTQKEQKLKELRSLDALESLKRSEQMSSRHSAASSRSIGRQCRMPPGQDTETYSLAVQSFPSSSSGARSYQPSGPGHPGQPGGPGQME